MIHAPKTRFAMIGAGAIAQTYAQAFSQCRSAQLIGVADTRADAAEAMANTLGCRSFSCYRTMIEELSPEAVVVCTPPISHPEISRWLLHRGIHVLCEKPLAIDSTSARHMFEAAEAGGAKLTMATKFRFVDDVVRAKAIVASGILGDIVLFENTFTAQVDMTRRWNSNPQVSGGGVLIDNGTHSVDITRFFLGPLVEIQVVEGKRVQDLPVEDTVRMFVRSEAGVMGSIDLSWAINKQQPQYISIYGSQGTIVVGWRESKYRRRSDDEWITFGSGYNKLQAFTDQIENFALALRGEETLRVSPEDALASVEAVEAAYAALERTRWQPVPTGRRSRNGNSKKRPTGTVI
jgi:predicted dehydrogenase